MSGGQGEGVVILFGHSTQAAFQDFELLNKVPQETIAEKAQDDLIANKQYAEFYDCERKLACWIYPKSLEDTKSSKKAASTHLLGG